VAADSTVLDSLDDPGWLLGSHLLDSGASIEEVADLLGDNPQTLYKHYRHRVRPVADAAAERMQRLFG